MSLERVRVRLEELAARVGVPDRFRLFDCPVCLDVGLVFHKATLHGHEYDRSWYCTCPKGQDREMAKWFSRIYFPGKRGTWVVSDRGMADFRAYIAEGQWPQTQFIGKAFEKYAEDRMRRKG